MWKAFQTGLLIQVSFFWLLLQENLERCDFGPVRFIFVCVERAEQQNHIFLHEIYNNTI